MSRSSGLRAAAGGVARFGCPTRTSAVTGAPGWPASCSPRRCSRDTAAVGAGEPTAWWPTPRRSPTMTRTRARGAPTTWTSAGRALMYRTERSSLRGEPCGAIAREVVRACHQVKLEHRVRLGHDDDQPAVVLDAFDRSRLRRGQVVDGHLGALAQPHAHRGEAYAS